jgi:hypothetical protein
MKITRSLCIPDSETEGGIITRAIIGWTMATLVILKNVSSSSAFNAGEILRENFLGVEENP